MAKLRPPSLTLSELRCADWSRVWPWSSGGRPTTKADQPAAARPYLDKAAPHEHLFSGDDLRNFEALSAAISDGES